MSFKSMMNEKASWKKREGMSDTGKVLFAEPVDINCIIEDKVQLRVTDTDERMFNYSVVTTTSKDIQIGDEINDRPVVSVTKIKNLRGKVEGNEVYLT